MQATSQLTAQTPRTSLPLPPSAFAVSNAFTRLTSNPTPNGPMIVHKTIAHVTIKNSWSFPPTIAGARPMAGNRCVMVRAVCRGGRPKEGRNVSKAKCRKKADVPEHVGRQQRITR